MEKIIIFDYVKGITYVRDFYNSVHTPEDIIEELGLNVSDCEWMVTSEFKLNLK